MLMGRGVVALAGLLVTSTSLFAQAVDPGRRAFEARARAATAPTATAARWDRRSPTPAPLDDQQLMKLIRRGQPLKGMPPNVVPDAEMADLVKFLRTIERDGRAPAGPRCPCRRPTAGRSTAWSSARASTTCSCGPTTSACTCCARAGDAFREVTSETDWPSYNGDPGGNRYTTLTQIDKTNVARLAPKWMFTLPDAGQLQGTPVVVDGIMYVTAPNECYALDAGTGRQIWHFKRPRTKGIAGGGANRGVAVAGDRVFMVTDNAHLIALNRFTGELLWDTELADWRQNYSASSAPLAAGNLVISGVSGGEHGANGFVAAYDQATGKEVWRFWTVPKPGEPGSETWQGKDIEHGGAPTWFTGSYDPALDIVYWPTGNPSQGIQRRRSHRATTSTRARILALDREDRRR